MKMPSVPLLLLAAVAAACCGTHLDGRKRDRAPVAGSELLPGIPISMTRPEFVMTEKPGNAGMATYDLAVEWVADPDEQYVVNIDPAMLAEVDFGLTLGAHGQLVTANANKRDQVGPTIAAVGEFAASIISSAGKLAAAYDVASLSALDQPKWDELFATLKLLELHASQGKARLWDETARPSVGEPPPAYAGCPAPKDHRSNHWRVPTTAELQAIPILVTELRDTTRQLSSLLPFPAERRIWLTSAAYITSCRVNEAKRNVATAEKQRQARAAALHPRLRAHLGDPMAWNDLQRDAYVTLLDQVRTPSGQKAPPDPLTAAIQNVDAQFAGNLSADIVASLRALASDYASLAAAHRTQGKQEAEHAFVQYLLDADDDLRLARVVALEREIEAATRADALASVSVPSSAVRDLRERWLVAIGAAEEAVREKNLLHILSDPIRVTGLSPEAQARAVQDYAAVSQELGNVRQTIAQKRTALERTAGKAKDPSERKLRVRSIDHAGTGRSTPAWVRSIVGLDEPEFVIVLERGYQR